MVMLLSAVSAPHPSHAQSQGLPLSQTRAANLARMRAEAINGGVSNYRADRCMYSTGAPNCLVRSNANGYVFRFKGGAPGWQQKRPNTPTVQSTITVSADGQTIQSVTNNPLP